MMRLLTCVTSQSLIHRSYTMMLTMIMMLPVQFLLTVTILLFSAALLTNTVNLCVKIQMILMMHAMSSMMHSMTLG